MVEPQDVALAQQIAGADSQAENELFRRYAEQIKLMVRARLKGKAPRADQEDIVSEIQEALLLSLRKGGYDPATGKTLGAYIAGIAFNIIGQYFRKKKKASFVEFDARLEAQPDTANDTLSALVESERDAKLRKCLSRLQPQYKEVLLLRIYEQRSIEAIARDLNLERRRVSERIHYAFKLLLKECQKENYFSIFLCFLQI